MSKQRWFNQVVRLVVVALMAAPWLTAVSASAAKIPHQGLTRSSALLNPRPLFSDFDGDKLPDAAELSSRGQHKTIYVNLSNYPAVSLSFDSQRQDLGRLISRDIDHDSDQDLIWYSQASPQAIVFWLNDGKGHFGPATRYQQSDARPDLDLTSLPKEDAETDLSDNQSVTETDCGLRTADTPVVELTVREKVITPAAPLASHRVTHCALSACLKIIHKRGPPTHLS